MDSAQSQLKKILVIAQSEAKAGDAEKVIKTLAPEVSIKKVYLGVKRVPRHFDAVVVYHTTTNEVNFIKDEVQRYGEAPIKAFLSKIGVPAYADAASHKAKAFSGDRAEDLIKHLK